MNPGKDPQFIPSNLAFGRLRLMLLNAIGFLLPYEVTLTGWTAFPGKGTEMNPYALSLRRYDQ